ncbi:MAG: hypothetical protein MSG64_06530 [Pyrinomonadaceae bacterium MAG19_C2-C3]|nr:hypothetical protein [Pyrinomonadaceae bacterium MAG19_C2-C3]
MSKTFTLNIAMGDSGGKPWVEELTGSINPGNVLSGKPGRDKRRFELAIGKTYVVFSRGWEVGAYGERVQPAGAYFFMRVKSTIEFEIIPRPNTEYCRRRFPMTA